MSLTEFAADSGTAIAEEATAETRATDQFATLDLAVIVPSLTNPRSTFDETSLAELAESIAASGVHQPILVRPLPASRLDETSRKVGRAQRETHEIVAGERRFRASKLAGKTTIPALVRHLNDAQVLEIQIVENLQREDLSELEEAEGYHRLVEQTSVAKEEIGTKIGKSRSYVYQRLKLLDLNSAAREALRKGELDFSKALLIARIPNDKLQIKALGQATGSDNYGRALSSREFQDWLQTNVMLSLKRTSFDIKDVTLREGAGACQSCPKRTGANPDLFADVESADLCTDPTCYHDKEKATAERRFEAAQAEGKKVIDQDQAAKMVKANSREWLKGHYILDHYPDYNLEVDGATLRKALGKYCPEPVLVKHPESGEIHEAVPVDQVKRIIRDQGLTRSAKHAARTQKKDVQVKAEEKKLPVEERPEFDDRWQKAATIRAVEIIKSKPLVGTPDLLRAWLIDEGEHDYELADAIKRALEVDSDREMANRIASTPDEELPRLLMLFMFFRAIERYNAWSDDEAKRQGPRSSLFEVLYIAGVDAAEIKAETKRVMESEDRATEEAELQKTAETKTAATAEKPAKAQKAKKSTAPPAAQATRARKPSKEQVQRDIADAFQALEDGKPGENQAPDGAGQEAPAAPTAGEPAPTFNVGDIARVKAGSKSGGGKKLKTIGKVGRVVGVGDDGRIHLRHGARSHELVVLEPGQLEHYKADPLIGSKVRIVSSGAHLWKHGVVRAIRVDGWGIALEGDDHSVVCGFTSDELEVLA